MRKQLILLGLAALVVACGGSPATGQTATSTASAAPPSGAAPTATPQPSPAAPHLQFADTAGTWVGPFVPGAAGVKCFSDPNNFNKPVVSSEGSVGSKHLNVFLVIGSGAQDRVSFTNLQPFTQLGLAPVATATAGKGFDMDSDLFTPPYPPGTATTIHVKGTLNCTA